ncbi:MAG: hypothetical protein QOK35_1452, partial [Pseudonocardiales bacterium]|nr:hypothetical protein [Pseudonocardiales bacterium]
QPSGPPRPPIGPYPPPTAPRRSVRAWLASLSGARLLAWTGAAVTLLGVVLLLALAAARGWFAPPVRVGAGAVLGLGLLGLGVRLHRRPTARVGALAVAGTGVATLYLVVAAATALYRYLPVPAGLLLALLVAAAGLGLADRWRSALLATGTVVGAALLAPVVTERPTPLLVALVLVLQAAASVVALRRAWPVLAGVGAAWPVLYGTIVAGLAVPADRTGTIAVAVAVLVLGVAAAAWNGRHGSDGALEPSVTAALPRGLRIGLVVAAPVPALTFAAVVDGWTGAALAFLAAVLLFAAAALPGRDHVLRTAALAAGAVALFEATAVALDGDARTAVLLGQGVALLTVAAALRSRAVLVVGGFFATAGVLAALAVQIPPAALASFPSAPFVLNTTPQRAALLAAVLMSALVLAAAVTALVASARVGLLGADARAAGLWAPVGLVGLYGAAGLVIAVALLVAPTRSAFVAGHAAVTVSWTVVALVMLARGIRRPAMRVAGLVLVAAAVAKLVLFDLVALDGLARVAAFLGAGLLLLAAGTRYARLVAEAESAGEPGPGESGPGESGPVGTGPGVTSPPRT